MRVYGEAAEVSGGIVSDPWVDQMAGDQRAAIDDLGTEPRLDVVMTESGFANRSYDTALRRWGERIGLEVVTHGFDDDDQAADFIRDLAGDPNVDGILPLMPSWTTDGGDRIRHALPGGARDVDSVGPAASYVPATAAAMAAAAERITGKPLTEQGPIGVIGRGPRTNGPLIDRILADAGIEPAVIIGGREQIKALKDHGEGAADLQQCDTVFTATPAGVLLTPDRVRQGQTIVDAGCGIDEVTGQPCGNIDPQVLGMDGLVKATPFRRGVGPLTTAIITGRVIANHTIQTGHTEPARAVA